MKCLACKQQIIFCKTDNGEVPVNATSLSPEDLQIVLNMGIITYRPEEHILHFATCTDHDFFRRERERKNGIKIKQSEGQSTTDSLFDR
jgi:hypothetical protein